MPNINISYKIIKNNFNSPLDFLLSDEFKTMYLNYCKYQPPWIKPIKIDDYVYKLRFDSDLSVSLTSEKTTINGFNSFGGVIDLRRYEQQNFFKALLRYNMYPPELFSYAMASLEDCEKIKSKINTFDELLEKVLSCNNNSFYWVYNKIDNIFTFRCKYPIRDLIADKKTIYKPKDDVSNYNGINSIRYFIKNALEIFKYSEIQLKVNEDLNRELRQNAVFNLSLNKNNYFYFDNQFIKEIMKIDNGLVNFSYIVKNNLDNKILNKWD